MPQKAIFFFYITCAQVLQNANAFLYTAVVFKPNPIVAKYLNMSFCLFFFYFFSVILSVLKLFFFFFFRKKKKKKKKKKHSHKESCFRGGFVPSKIATLPFTFCLFIWQKYNLSLMRLGE